MPEVKDRAADSCVMVVRGKNKDGTDTVVISGVFTTADLDDVREAAVVYSELDVTWLRLVVLRGTAWSPAQLLNQAFLGDIRRHAPGVLLADIHTHGDVPAGWR